MPSRRTDRCSAKHSGAYKSGTASINLSSSPPRRFVWNFFRLENEHLNNCGEFRAVRDISVAPLNADDLTLLDQMMDQEDGVRNRCKNKQWKRSQSISLRRPRLASQYVWPLLLEPWCEGSSLCKAPLLH